jgi:hypothetical protein
MSRTLRQVALLLARLVLLAVLVASFYYEMPRVLVTGATLALVAFIISDLVGARREWRS